MERGKQKEGGAVCPHLGDEVFWTFRCLSLFEHDDSPCSELLLGSDRIYHMSKINITSLINWLHLKF